MVIGWTDTKLYQNHETGNTTLDQKGIKVKSMRTRKKKKKQFPANLIAKQV